MKREEEVIFITGASKRLGRDIATALAENGWSLMLHGYESMDELKKTQAVCYSRAGKGTGQKFLMVQGDFSTAIGVERVLYDVVSECRSSLYGIVNNVGLFEPGSPCEMSHERLKMMFQLNLFAPVQIIRELVPHIKKRERGAIVNIGTCGLNRLHADTFAPFYLSSKQSLLALTRSYAKELAPSHISVNMVSPGKLDISVDHQDPRHVIPYGRLGHGEEVSSVVAFLMDAANNYITGQNIEVAGGFCL